MEKILSNDNLNQAFKKVKSNKGAGGGHHGSHPHLVHEFVQSILEDREPWINYSMGANITAAGICAHMSAMADGEGILIPDFKL